MVQPLLSIIGNKNRGGCSEIIGKMDKEYARWRMKSKNIGKRN